MKIDYAETPTHTGASLLRLFVLLALVLTVTMFVACSTTEGLGKDVKKLGSNVEDSAARNK